MVNWGAKLAIRITEADGTKTLITPLESFDPQIQTPHLEIDSTEQERLGWERQPTRFSFTLSVKAVGDAAQVLSRLQLNRDEFEIGIAEENTETGDWAFTSVLFTRCKITSSNPTRLSNNGAPVASYNGGALEGAFDDVVAAP